MAPNLEKLKPYELLRKNAGGNVRKVFFSLSSPYVVKALLYLLRPLYMKKETWFNRSFRYYALSLGAGSMAPEDIKAMLFSIRAVAANFLKAIDAAENNQPVVWVEWILQGEIGEAFDLTTINPEALNVYGNSLSGEYPPLLIEAAEKQGTPIENCSAQKLAIGAYISKQTPPPSLIIGGSHPCDTSVSVYQTLEYLTGAPAFILDVPYWKDEGAYKYFEDNIWELIAFLEKHTGKPADWDKLRTVLERVNQINYYLREVCEMARAIPCPSSINTLLFAWATREIDVRSPHMLDMAKALYENSKKRFDKGQGVIKNEKVRIIMWFPPIAFYLYFFTWLEKEFGAVVVADFIGHISTIQVDTSSKESMVEGLAKAQMHLAMGRQCHGPMDFFTDELNKMIDDYSPDCIFFMGHNGCKHGWAGLKIVQDTIKQRGLPALYLNIDIMDKRHTSETEIKKQITDFMVSHGWG